MTTWTFDKPSDPGICKTTGKLVLTRKEARDKAHWWRTQRFARMHHYRCGDHWHIGNSRHKPKQR